MVRVVLSFVMSSSQCRLKNCHLSVCISIGTPKTDELMDKYFSKGLGLLVRHQNKLPPTWWNNDENILVPCFCCRQWPQHINGYIYVPWESPYCIYSVGLWFSGEVLSSEHIHHSFDTTLRHHAYTGPSRISPWHSPGSWQSPSDQLLVHCTAAADLNAFGSITAL